MKNFYSCSSHLARFNSLFTRAILVAFLSFFATINSDAQCNNVTSGGSIGSNQSGCSPFDPSTITNVAWPTGGSGNIQYMWLFKNATTGWNFQTVSGASSASYDPGPLTETTTFRRCSRRNGCTSWDGETNDVTITITGNCNPSGPQALNCTGQFSWTANWSLNGCTVNSEVLFVDGGTFNIALPSAMSSNNIVINSIHTSSYDGYCNRQNVTQPNEKWKIVFFKNGNVVGQTGYTTDIQDFVVENTRFNNFSGFNLPNGADQMRLVHFEDPTFGNGPDNSSPNSVRPSGVCINYTIQNTCNNITDGGIIGTSANGCAPFDVHITSTTLPSGGSGNIEYMWLYKNASTNWEFQTVPNANGPSLDYGLINQTTTFRRCSRRTTCTAWDGETNDVTITITGNCNPDEICLVTGYQSTTGRIFWIPNFGTDFRSADSDPLVIHKFDNGAARMFGTIERISNPNARFYVNMWFDTKSTFAQWSMMGLSAHSPQWGDESTWTFYKFSETIPSTLTGQGSLTGTNLVLTNQVAAYGFQLGNGANALNANDNGLSVWFSYTGSASGHGDINGSYDCEAGCPGVCASDTTPPVFQNVPPNVTISCTNGNPPVVNPTASDDCDTNVDIQFEQNIIGEDFPDTTHCQIFDAGAGHTLWISSELRNALGLTSNNFVSITPGSFKKFEDGSIKITGIVQSASNPNKKFEYTAHYHLKRTYEEWTAIPNPNTSTGFRAEKLDAGTTITLGFEYFDWHYYEMNPSVPNTLVGLGDLAGVNLTISHFPEDYRYAAQLGENASLQSYGLGFSSWILLQGDVFGNHITDHGDFNFNIENCSNPDATVDCDDNYMIVREWTATDNCGNQSVATQTITVVGDQVPPTFDNLPGNQTVACGELPTIEELGVTASDNCDPSVIVTGSYQDQGSGCEYVRVYTWVATDDCGNQITASRTFTRSDDEEPVLMNLPNGGTAVCGNLPVPGSFAVTAEDECAGSVPVQVSFVDGGSGCNLTRTFTWTATDPCGNMVTASVVFNVLDNTAPVINNVPNDITLECGTPAPNAQVTAQDLCDNNVVPVLTTQIQTQACGFKLIRTWTATDDCGNVSTEEQIITYIDTQDPYIVNEPSDMEAICGSVIPVVAPTFDDSCDEELQVVFTQTQEPFGCTYKIIRKWVATDDCGNDVMAQQIITIVDNVPPIIVNVPANITVNCDAIPAPASNVSASDECDLSVNVVFGQSTQNLACGFVITRTWTATDDCGNTASASQLITVTDTKKPIINGVPADVIASCDNIPAVPTNVTASDICDSNVIPTFSQTIIPGDPSTGGCTYTIVRTWTAVDDCGNTETKSYSIIVSDNTPPTLQNAPANTTAECSSLPTAPELFATDNCTEGLIPAVLNVQIVPVSACSYNIIRTWTATDDCGNTASVVQTISVTDSTAPVFDNAPANVTVQCGNIPAVPVVTASDLCDATAEVSFFEMPFGSGCNYTIQRVWIASDDCGNSAVHTQIITVTDNLPPTLNGVPANTQVLCNAIPAAPVVTASDACDTNVPVTFSEQIGTGCPYTITRTWTATDDCGNVASATQVITVIDNAAPTLNGVPANTQVLCNAIPSAPVVTASDACDTNVPVTFSEQVGTGCPYTITRTWTATDDCGNVASATQVITVVDNAAPTLNGVPANTQVLCNAIPSAPVVTASDACDTNVPVTFSEQVGTGCPYTITRTWTAADDCGNVASATQVITVIDNAAPTLNGVPANTQVLCNAIPAAPVVTASDACDTNVPVTFSEQVGTGCPYTITRTWTATDDCGNVASATQVITVIDNAAPTLNGVPANTQVLCNAIPSAPVVTASDACDTNVPVTFSEQVGTGCPYTITRTWTATDDCGNVASATQVITVIDNAAPTLNGVPANTQVLCNAIPSAPVVTASDACDTNVPVTFSEQVGTGCPYTITRTWTATDDCGNVASATQVITVIDEVSPELIGVPLDATVECGSIPAVPAVAAFDECSGALQVSFNESVLPANCGYILQRFWTATDNCGNTISDIQVITVVDETDPYFTFVPQDVTILCTEALPTDSATAADICDPLVSVEFIDLETELACGSLITRTWTATDECGNTSSAIQSIIITDVEGPVVTEPLEEVIQLECGSALPTDEPVFEDECGLIADVVYSENTVDQSCGYDVVRTWEATDNCGNSTQFVQTVEIRDTQDPIITGQIQVETQCNVPYESLVDISDNCDTDLDITVNELMVSGGCAGVIIRTFTATDDCGNSATFQQFITLIDETAPTALNAPADTTIQCGQSIPAVATVTFEDNCNGPVTTTFNESSEDTDCGEIITRVWTALDECENLATVTQVITVTDSIAPVISNVPSDLNLECGSAIPPVATTVTAFDACNGVLQVSVTEATNQVECGFEIVRTYSATDNCDNVASVSQTITVIDTQAPFIDGAVENITVACDDIPAAPVFTATDLCDTSVPVIFSEQTSVGCPYTITRRWTAADDCGNEVELVQIINVIDTVLPTFDPYPLFAVISCDAFENYTLTASDNCDGDVEVEVISEVLFSGSCVANVERLYQATDNCGNSVIVSQIIQLVDTTVPQLFNVPANTTITCGSPVPAVPTNITATDNCDADVTITFTQTQTNTFCPYDIVRTWTAVDNCGNVTTGIQVITVTVEIEPNTIFKTYPNPAEKEFTFEFSTPTNATVFGGVYDITGREIIRLMQGPADGGRLYKQQIPVNALRAGTYTVMMRVDGEVYNQKLVIINR